MKFIEDCLEWSCTTEHSKRHTVMLILIFLLKPTLWIIQKETYAQQFFLYHFVLCYIIILPNKRQVSSQTRPPFPPPFILLTLSSKHARVGEWTALWVLSERERDLREPRSRVTQFSVPNSVWFNSVFGRVSDKLQESLKLRAVSRFLENPWERTQNK